MPGKPLVTVVIPTRGRPELLRAVGSVLDQTIQSIEVIVVVDGQGLLDEEIANEVLATKDVSVRILELRIPSGGPAKPRNIGIALASSEYIAFLDDDDWWLPAKLEQQLEIVASGEYIAVGSNAFRWDKGKVDGLYFTSVKANLRPSDFFLGNELITSSVLARTEALKAIGGFPENAEYRGFEDYLAWGKLASQGTIFNVDNALLYYEVPHTDSLSVEVKKSGMNPILIARKYWIGYFRANKKGANYFTAQKNAAFFRRIRLLIRKTART